MARVKPAELSAELDKVLSRMSIQSLKTSEKAIGATFTEILRDVVIATPVDKGIAQANWFLTENSPSSQTSESGNAQSRINKIEKTFNKKVLGKTFFFVNNLPYISSLEYGLYPKSVKFGSYDKKTKSYKIKTDNGFSKQAPDGMLETNLARFKSLLKSNFKRFKE